MTVMKTLALALTLALPVASLAAPPTAGTFTATQLPGRKFLVRGTISPPLAGGVVLSGVANGVLAADAAGVCSGIVDVSAPGQLVIRPGNDSGLGTPVTITLSNAAPSVTMAVTSLGNGTWRFAGAVTDDAAPVGLTVLLSGPPGVNGVAATVKADGTWLVDVSVGPLGGPVRATVSDGYNRSGVSP
jgi:hypothetical protein